MCLRNVILAALVSAAAASAQYSPFMVRYAANLVPEPESYINITNTGAYAAPLLGPGFGAAAGNICVNVYAIDPGEELISCCSCLVTPDQTLNLGVDRDLTANTLNGVIPTSLTIQLVATLAPATLTGPLGSGTSCTSSAATVTTATLGTGTMAAWGTTVHVNPTGGYDTAESAFTPATLSSSELASLGGRCAAILGNGSGAGICNSCRAGALGSSKLPQ
jgi:hypothetical protein